MEIGRKEGCHTIDDCLETLSLNNYITIGEVRKHCRDLRRFSPEKLGDK